MPRESFSLRDVELSAENAKVLWSSLHHCALQEAQGVVSLPRAHCHHKLCSVQHKSFGEKREGGVVWGPLLGFSSVGELGMLGRQQQGAVCVADERKFFLAACVMLLFRLVLGAGLPCSPDLASIGLRGIVWRALPAGGC